MTLLQKDTSWLLSATIGELQNLLEQNKLTSRDLVLLYFKRIAMLDREGPQLRSVLELNPDALGIADLLDTERLQGTIRGPLHGIPILIKDNIDTADGIHTSAGSLAPADHYAQADAFAVRKLRDAGAILLGKTNMTEWANLMSPTMFAGYCSRGGQTLNPYGSELFVGGSSSGSAVAVAAGLAAASLGTETNASVLSPACQNSLVGIKPTVGLVSRSGVIPVSFTQDTIGTFGKTVTDAAILLQAISASDPDDPVTGGNSVYTKPDYTESLKSTDLTGITIGIPRDAYFDDIDPEEAELAEKAMQALVECGAKIVDHANIPSAREDWDYGVAWLELKASLNRYLAKLPSHLPVHSLKDVIRFNLEPCQH